MLYRRAPLVQKAPIKRGKPMRNRGRNRVARGIDPNADQLEYWNTLPDVCEGCGSTQDIVVHHVLANAPGKQGRRDHWLIVKLCPRCHNMGTDSVHLLGSEAKFKLKTGVDLVAIAVSNRDWYWSGDPF